MLGFVFFIFAHQHVPPGGVLAFQKQGNSLKTITPAKPASNLRSQIIGLPIDRASVPLLVAHIDQSVQSFRYSQIQCFGKQCPVL